MRTKFVKWAGLGLGTAVLGIGLAACSPGGEGEGEGHTAGESSAVAHGEMGEGEHSNVNYEGENAHGESGEGEGGEHAHNMETLELSKRLAFMSGHVEAGLALYRANEPKMAAPHLLHPVSETHEAERAGLEELGFDPSLFEAVSKALDDGLDAAEIEPQLTAAEENLMKVTAKAGGDTTEIINYLMEVIVEEYSIAITDGKVTDPGEYQDAFGFAIVARKHAENMDGETASILAEIDGLVALWPEAPIPPEAPTPVGQIIAQTSKVKLVLP